MKTIAIYCAGRNELPPPGIKGIQYFPDRACVWGKLAEQYPDTQLRIYFNLPGEFIVDMWPDIFRESDLVSYIALDEDASVEDIAERIAADQPDLAIAFPYRSCHMTGQLFATQWWGRSCAGRG